VRSSANTALAALAVLGDREHPEIRRVRAELDRGVDGSANSAVSGMKAI
jgi:hypothetical protein